MSSIMKKEIDLQISNNETNACSRNRNRNRNAVTAPSAGAQFMQRPGKAPAVSPTPIPSKEFMKLKYTKVKLQPVTLSSSRLLSLSLLPSSSSSVVPAPLLPSTSVVPAPLLPSSWVAPAPPPSPPEHKAYVPILPRPQTALRINSNAAENIIRPLGPADMTLSGSYDLGNGDNCPFRFTSSQAHGRGGSGLNGGFGLTSDFWSYGRGSGLTHPFGIGSSSQSSYGWGRGAQSNWLTSPSSISRAGNRAALQLGGSILSQPSVTNNYRYHPYMARNMDMPSMARNMDMPNMAPNMDMPNMAPNMDMPNMDMPNMDMPNMAPNMDMPYMANERSSSTVRTIDFLSKMEAKSSESSEEMQGRRGFKPSREMLLFWGSKLKLGNGRRRSVDLNLRIRLGN